MEPDLQHERASEVFCEARELPPAERPAFLERACGSDQQLRENVEKMLANAGGPTLQPLPHNPAAALRELTDTDDNVGRRIGPYLLKRRIGGGGMGDVCFAVRERPAQSVALKLIKRGMDSADVLRRFCLEQQTLAALSHPGIARFLDGGETPDHLPFFVMEYVAGQPIDKFCDEHKLSITDRLRLFQSVCAAVQHAHQRGILHRDLKPANILVTVDPQTHQRGVKLIDFGIAKLTVPEFGAESLTLTMPEHRFLTLEYASPEQYRNEPLTTASDIYSLGVVLYELLRGYRPYRLVRKTPREVEELICELDPELMSTAVMQDVIEEHEGGTKRLVATPETVGRSRSDHPRSVRRRLRGDLDVIVAKALRKEPSRRYGSAEALSQDIELHLQGRPITARPDSLSYVLTKFAWRHVAAAIGTAAVVLCLVGGIVGTTTAMRDAQAQRRVADKAVEQKRDALKQTEEALAKAKEGEARANAVTQFVQRMLASADPANVPGHEITVREALVVAAQTLETGAAVTDAATEAAIRFTLGDAFRSIGSAGDAQRHLERALELEEHLHPEPNAETLRILYSLMRLHSEVLSPDAAEVYAKRAEDLALAIYGPDSVHRCEPLGVLAVCARNRSSMAESQAYLAEARRILMTSAQAEDTPFDDIRWMLFMFSDLESILQADIHNPLADADLQSHTVSFQRRLVTHFINQYGPVHPRVASARSGLGFALFMVKDYKAAELELKAALDLLQHLYREPHIDVADCLARLGMLCEAMGRLEEAVTYHRDALKTLRGVYVMTPAHPKMLVQAASLGHLLVKLERQDEAAVCFVEVCDLCRKAPASSSVECQEALEDAEQFLGRWHRQHGRLEDAARAFALRVDLRKELNKPPSIDDVVSLQDLVGVLEKLGRTNEARVHYDSAVSLLRDLMDASNDVSVILNALHERTPCAHWDYSDTLDLWCNTIRILNGQMVGDANVDPLRYVQLNFIGKRTWDLAVRSGELRLAHLRTLEDPGDEVILEARLDRAFVLAMNGETDASQRELEQTLHELRAMRSDVPVALYARCLRDLGARYLLQGRYPEGQQLLEELVCLQHDDAAMDDQELGQTLDGVCHFLDAHNLPGELAAASEKALRVWIRFGGPDCNGARAARFRLASALRDSGQLAAAQLRFEENLASWGRDPQPDSEALSVASSELASVLVLQCRDLDRASLLFDEAIAQYTKVDSASGLVLNRLRTQKAAVGQLLGSWADAQALLTEVLTDQRARDGTPKQDIAATLALIGQGCVHRREYADAVGVLEEALRLQQEVLPADHWSTRCTASLLGLALAESAQRSAALSDAGAMLARAERLAVDGYSKMEPPPVPLGALRKREALARLVRVYDILHEIQPDRSMSEDESRFRALLVEGPASRPIDQP